MLKEAIDAKWGSFDHFKAEFAKKTIAIQGSGWGWLAFSPAEKELTIVTCPNQDPCVSTGNIPLFGVDVWEHAYYLDYKNVRPDYVNAIWKIANFQVAEERYLECISD